MNQNELRARVDFSIIRYANCWEDADVVLEAMGDEPGRRFLSVASAGDNTLSLLALNPEKVVAVDINPIQLRLFRLKIAAFRSFTHEELLAFLGFQPCAERRQMLAQLDLDKNDLHYWQNHAKALDNGFIQAGKFENYLRTFSHRILPLIHSSDTIDYLLESRSEHDLRNFYRLNWDNLRWRMLFRLFFSRRIMGWLGRDPAFLKEVQGTVWKQIYERAKGVLINPASSQNHMFHYCLTGTFGPLLPHYVRPENFEAIRRNLDKLDIREGLIGQIPLEPASFHGMNLSNIFEYMDPATFRKVGQEIASAMAPGGRTAYWNLMVPRRLAGALPEYFSGEDKHIEKLRTKDKGFFYESIYVDSRQ